MGSQHVLLNIGDDGLVKSVGSNPEPQIQYEICIMCGTETNIPVSTHIDFRTGYIEGAGQLCHDCFTRGSSRGRDMITIPRYFITDTPNDMELGGKIRQYYYSEYGDREPQIQNQWICEFCGLDTSHVDSDYLVNQNHLSCTLENEGIAE